MSGASAWRRALVEGAGIRPARLSFSFEGGPIEAYEGETVAAALLAAGHLGFRRTAGRHESRGLYCGIGLCQECLLTINGRPCRACVTLVEQGDEVRVHSLDAEDDQPGASHA